MEAEIPEKQHIGKLDFHERQLQNHQKVQQKLKSLNLIKSKKVIHNVNNCDTNIFVGFWILDSCEDWNLNTLFELYKDENGILRCQFYDGTQPHLREINANDLFTPSNPVSPAGLNIETEILNARSLRFINNLPIVTTDDLTSTFRIQDGNDNLAISQFYTTWDGSADDPHYGSVENLSIWKRLPVRPQIQMNYLPSPIDWTNPINMFNYVNEYYFYLGMPQKAVSLQQVDFIGSQEAEALRLKFLSTGVERVSTVSTKKRADKYIGVWKTQFPNLYPITTIHTEEPHHFNSGSTVEISGFKGPFKRLNGTHKVSAIPSTVSLSTPEPWQKKESREYFIYVQVDTSDIEVEYKPCKYGVATIKAQHGPVTPTTNYRDFFAALFDYNVTVWGPGTHSRIRVWRDNQFLVPETFDELKAGIADSSLTLLTANFRTYNASTGSIVYHNPFIQGGNIRFPAVNINDPFGIGQIEYEEKYNYDIDIKNYLHPNKTFSLFWTITGPILPEQPLTGSLLDLGLGYPSNGSQIVWKTNTWGVFPEPLVDEFGTHDWRLFAAADNDPGTVEYQLYHNFVFGIIDKKYTKNKKIGYIRIGDEDGFDSPWDILAARSLAFGRNDMPFNKIKSNQIFGLATIVAKLNQFGVEKIILDIRDNGGGFAHLPSAYGYPFGGNRIGFTSSIGFPGNGNRDPIQISQSGFKTAFDSLQINNTTDELIDTDELASLFPQGVFRGNDDCRKELIILTNTMAASAGDMLPHTFLGPDPNTTVHDIGHNVFARIVGDIDGRLWSGLKSYDGLAIDPLNYNLSQNGEPRTCVYLATEAGLLNSDRHGTLVNYQKWTQPNILLPTWFDTTVWQDLGLTEPKLKYPLCKHQKGCPDFEDPSSWRDVILEYAITK